MAPRERGAGRSSSCHSLRAPSARSHWAWGRGAGVLRPNWSSLKAAVGCDPSAWRRLTSRAPRRATLPQPLVWGGSGSRSNGRSPWSNSSRRPRLGAPVRRSPPAAGRRVPVLVYERGLSLEFDRRSEGPADRLPPGRPPALVGRAGRAEPLPRPIVLPPARDRGAPLPEAELEEEPALRGPLGRPVPLGLPVPLGRPVPVGRPALLGRPDGLPVPVVRLAPPVRVVEARLYPPEAEDRMLGRASER